MMPKPRMDHDYMLQPPTLLSSSFFHQSCVSCHIVGVGYTVPSIAQGLGKDIWLKISYGHIPTLWYQSGFVFWQYCFCVRNSAMPIASNIPCLIQSKIFIKTSPTISLHCNRYVPWSHLTKWYLRDLEIIIHLSFWDLSFVRVWLTKH